MSVLKLILVNRDGRIRAGWWIGAFLGLLAGMLVPALLFSAKAGRDLSVWEQALIIATATVVIQLLRRKPVLEVTGAPSRRSLLHLSIGLALGALLMLLPALLMLGAGWVRFVPGTPDPRALASAFVLMAGVAIAEELLFRGVLFQRLTAGIGAWPAQAVIGLLFVLTHMDNPGMDGATRWWAGANIFCASLVFGLGFIRTGGLALPIGLHFMANATQGLLLGFGVSGNAEPSLFTPRFLVQADWLTGGAFGLEASLPGLLAVVLLLALFVAVGRKGLAAPDPAAHRDVAP